jgi:hypothetical protein
VPSDHWALLLKLDINKGKKQNDEKKKDDKKVSKIDNENLRGALWKQRTI